MLSTWKELGCGKARHSGGVCGGCSLSMCRGRKRWPCPCPCSQYPVPGGGRAGRDAGEQQPADLCSVWLPEQFASSSPSRWRSGECKGLQITFSSPIVSALTFMARLPIKKYRLLRVCVGFEICLSFPISFSLLPSFRFWELLLLVRSMSSLLTSTKEVV